MTIKYSKILALAGVAVLTSMMVTPSQAADPVVPVTTTAAITTGSITVVQKVINDNNGTKVAGDFTMSVKHWGTPVAGSPFVATDGIGKTFVLEAGTYVVSQDIIEGYDGTWSGVGVINGFIDLQPGQAITIVRTLNDNGLSTSVPVVTEVPATDNGGVLPNTASPWFNLLLVGSLMAAAGALGVRKSIKLHQAI
jgi:hypothetical protein